MSTETSNKLVQHPFWDMCNSAEMHLVVGLQNLFKVCTFKKFWKKMAFVGSSGFISLFPTIFYALGMEESSRQLAASLMVYSLFSSVGKFVFRRRRPGTYEVVHSSPTTSMAAFPSRHTMGMTVLASFLPFKHFFVLFMAVDRMLLGKHFVSDCVVGYILGEMCVKLGKTIDNINLLMIMLFAGMMLWKSATRVMAGTVPVLVAPIANCTPYMLPIALLKVISMNIVKRQIPKAEKMKILIADLFTTSLTLYILATASKYYTEGVFDVMPLNMDQTKNFTEFFENLSNQRSFEF